MTRAEKYLERLVSRETAARKVAALRRHAGREGGWIYTADGLAICQGWRNYADRCQTAGLIGRDEDTGKWFVSVAWLSQAELQRAEDLYGSRRP